MVLIVCFGIHGTGGSAEKPFFTDITEASGIAQLVTDHYAAHPTWWLSGLHLVDLDADGDLDLFLSAHGKGDSLAALNDGSGHFTRAAGTYPSTEIHLCYDSDEDGRIDLTMTYQDGGGQWWRNRSKPGELLFDPTGITRGTNTARRQAMIDINHDGHVDWLRGTDTGIEFDFGDGHGGFAKGSSRLAVTQGRDEVLCLPCDIDGDGDIDLQAEWGHYSAPDGNCRIYRNDGAMTFTDVTADAGLPGTGTAIKGVGDVDQDGDPDLICLEHRQHFEIYLNDGTGRFVKKDGAIRGIKKGAAYASWGIAVTTDFDNDGVADILVNGKHFLKILKGTGGGYFQYVNAIWGIADVSAASIDDGLCFGDIDADGDLDIVGYTSIDGQRRFAVYRNDLPSLNWLRIRLIGSRGNRGAAGAKIRVYTPGGSALLWYEQVAVYDSQAAASCYALPVTERHFGLGKRETVDVSVEFYPSRRLIWKRGVNANETVEIHERSPDEEPSETEGGGSAPFGRMKQRQLEHITLVYTPESQGNARDIIRYAVQCNQRPAQWFQPAAPVAQKVYWMGRKDWRNKPETYGFPYANGSDAYLPASDVDLPTQLTYIADSMAIPAGGPSVDRMIRLLQLPEGAGPGELYTQLKQSHEFFFVFTAYFILPHELTHGFCNHLAYPQQPRWCYEGIAQWAAYKIQGQLRSPREADMIDQYYQLLWERGTGLKVRDFARADELGADGLDTPNYAWYHAGLLCMFRQLEEMKGGELLPALLEAIRRRHPGARSVPQDQMIQTFSEVIGQDLKPWFKERWNLGSTSR